MSALPIGDILIAIAKVGEEIGTNLIPLFQKHEPRLITEPLPDAAGDMDRARNEALARAKAHEAAEAVADEIYDEATPTDPDEPA